MKLILKRWIRILRNTQDSGTPLYVLSTGFVLIIRSKTHEKYL